MGKYTNTSLYVSSWLICSSLTFVLCHVNCVVEAGDSFTSIETVKRLLRAEPTFIRVLEQYLKDEHLRLSNLERHLGVVKERQRRLDQGSFASHPLNAFHLIHEWVDTLTAALADSVKLAREANDQINSCRVALPNWTDLDGVSSAVLRLQTTYQLSTDQLVRGEVHGVHSSRPLDPDDCYVIGIRAVDMGHFGLAREWLIAARNMSQVGSDTRRYVDPQLIFVDKKLLEIEQSHRVEKPGLHAEQASKYSQSHLYDVHHVSYENKQHHKDQELRSPADNTEEKRREQDRIKMRQNYEAICRGDIKRPVCVQSKLYCTLRRGRHSPFFLYKQEVHNLDPLLVQFYDVISKTDADLLISAANQSLVRSQVGANHTNSREFDGRISQQSWVNASSQVAGRVVTKLNARIEDIVGLDASSSTTASASETFQVLNYGVGGQYEPHYDYLSVTNEAICTHVSHFCGSGDRIATFIFYFGDVLHGGDTAFPLLNLGVSPVKYSAAFWFNLKADGQTDRRTLHAGCPVLLGDKWIANKWIRERAQMFRRKCPRNIHDEDL